MEEEKREGWSDSDINGGDLIARSEFRFEVMEGFARIGNNKITVLVNDAEKSSDIDPQEAQQTLEIAEANLSKAEGKRQIIEASLALRRARTRVEAINMIS